MSAQQYMPYIEGAMEHIKRIYEWNERVDEMRDMAMDSVIAVHDLDPKNNSVRIDFPYSLNDWLRMYYEEKQEYTEAMLSGDKQEIVDAIVDQFVIAIGEIRKCAISDYYERIAFWEEIADNAYNWSWYDNNWVGNDEFNKAITEVIDALFTRFWPGAYIDENGKFIKDPNYRKPDLSFIK